MEGKGGICCEADRDGHHICAMVSWVGLLTSAGVFTRSSRAYSYTIKSRVVGLGRWMERERGVEVSDGGSDHSCLE